MPEAVAAPGSPAITWLTFGLWIAVVLAFYVLYGLRNAVLNHVTDFEDIAEPRGDEED